MDQNLGGLRELASVRDPTATSRRLPQVFARHERTTVILWRLRGYTDPEGEYGGTEVVCSCQKEDSAYRLLVRHGDEVQVDEGHTSVATVQARADALRAELLQRGWTLATARRP